MFKKICFFDYTMETASIIKDLINEGYVLKKFPTKPILKYVRFDKKKEFIKVSKCKREYSKEKQKEAYELFKKYNKGLGDHLYDEVGKLICVCGAGLKGREEQFDILKQTFNDKKQELNKNA